VDRRRLEAALAFCAGKKSPKAMVSQRILAGLLDSPGKTAKVIATEAGCSRGYLFSAIRAAQHADYERLATEGAFRKSSLLSPVQRKETGNEAE